MKCAASVLCELQYTLFCFPDGSGGDGEEGKRVGDGGDRVGGRAEGGEQICVGKTQCAYPSMLYLAAKISQSGESSRPVDKFLDVSLVHGY